VSFFYMSSRFLTQILCLFITLYSRHLFVSRLCVGQLMSTSPIYLYVIHTCVLAYNILAYIRYYIQECFNNNRDKRVQMKVNRDRHV
jgi:hypothetical protein